MRRRPNGVSAMADGGPSRSSGTSSLEIEIVRHSDLWDSIEVSDDALSRARAGRLRGVFGSAG